MGEIQKSLSGINFVLTKYESQKLTVDNIDEIIKNEKEINERLLIENQKVKENNFEIQKKLLNYIDDNNVIQESNVYEDIEKYNIILITASEYIKKLKELNIEMQHETFLLFEEFFKYIRKVFLTQYDLCYVIKKDMNNFRIHEKEKIFQTHYLALRKIYDHNSILRAQISCVNKFKLKHDNLLHADFEQLETKYKHLKLKENNLKCKIENLNKKIIKANEKKLHYDEKSMYLENLLNKKKKLLEDSYIAIKKKKKLLNDLKKKKEEILKKYNESETNIIARNVFEIFQKKKIYFENLQKMVNYLKKKKKKKKKKILYNKPLFIFV